MLDGEWVRIWMRLAAQEFAERRAELNELDAQISDGDHGDNLERGYRAAWDAARESFATDSARILREIGLTFLSAVNGSSGPMLASTFLRMSETAAEVQESDGRLEPEAVAAVIEAGARGVVWRGRSEPGSKTMTDAWIPASHAAREAAETGLDCIGVLEAAAVAAGDGAAATAYLQAGQGCAQFRAERSVGFVDAGAQSSAYMLGVAVRAARIRHSQILGGAATVSMEADVERDAGGEGDVP